MITFSKFNSISFDSEFSDWTHDFLLFFGNNLVEDGGDFLMLMFWEVYFCCGINDCIFKRFNETFKIVYVVSVSVFSD